MNPENGICFSALYNRAFDKGFIGINKDFRILISKELKEKEKEEFYHKHFGSLEGNGLLLPKKYMPKKEFLQYHAEIIFKH